MTAAHARTTFLCECPHGKNLLKNVDWSLRNKTHLGSFDECKTKTHLGFSDKNETYFFFFVKVNPPWVCLLLKMKPTFGLLVKMKPTLGL